MSKPVPRRKVAAEMKAYLTGRGVKCFDALTFDGLAALYDHERAKEARKKAEREEYTQ